MPTAPARYFAPTYNSPFYFPSLVTAVNSLTKGASRFRDRDAFGAIAAALTATGAFSEVAFGTTPDRWTAGADRTPAAVITPAEWIEIDDVDPYVIVRRVAYTLTVVVRDEDPVSRFEALDRLSGIAQNAIGGLDVGGTSLPGLSLLYHGRFDPTSRHPEQSLVMQGEYTYLIPSMTGHQTDY